MKKEKMRDESDMFDESTAYHEAAHAVMALDLGWPINTVTIVANKYTAGRLHHGKSRLDDGHQDLMGWFFILAAGPIAQGRFDPSQPWRDKLHFELKSQGVKEAESVPEEFVLSVKEVVQRRWPAIERLALLLLERNTMTGEEIQSAIERDELEINLVKRQGAAV
jgi:hypothetical protein